MAQYALPDGVLNATTNWAEGAGDGDGDAFDELDEGFGAGRGSGSGPDDATTYWLTTDQASNLIGPSYSDVTDPSSSVGHINRTRCAKDASGGRQMDLEFRLLEASNSRSTDTSNTNISNVWTTFTDTLTAVEADSIGNYANLGGRNIILETGGGSPRVGWCSAMEFECPDAGGPADQEPALIEGKLVTNSLVLRHLVH